MWCGSSPQSYGKFRKSASPTELAACDHTPGALLESGNTDVFRTGYPSSQIINEAEEMDGLRRTKYKSTVAHSKSLGANGF